VVKRIVSLSAEFENPLLVQTDILGERHVPVEIPRPEDFLETRNAPGAFYSMTAKPKAK